MPLGIRNDPAGAGSENIWHVKQAADPTLSLPPHTGWLQLPLAMYRLLDEEP